MGQTNPASVRISEGKTSIREVHSQPPDLPNLQMHGSTAWEPKSINPKVPVHVHQAWKPISDKGAYACPDLWPSPGIITVNLAACLGLALQLEGEQNFHIPCMGSKLHAASTAPQISSSSPLPPILSPPDTLAHENRRMEMVLPQSSTPLKTSAPNA
jgi:hypothetical protein